MLRNPEFWVLVSFVIFFVLFGGRLWKAVSAALDGRADAIRAELGEAQRLRHEAEAMLAEAHQAREAAIIEARDMLVRSQEEARRLTEAAATEAEASGRRRERMAQERIAAAEKAAITEMRNAAADLATKAASNLLAEGFGNEAELVDQAIAALPRALRAA